MPFIPIRKSNIHSLLVCLITALLLFVDDAFVIGCFPKHTHTIIPIALCGCETGSLILREECESFKTKLLEK